MKEFDFTGIPGVELQPSPEVVSAIKNLWTVIHKVSEQLYSVKQENIKLLSEYQILRNSGVDNLPELKVYADKISLFESQKLEQENLIIQLEEKLRQKDDEIALLTDNVRETGELEALNVEIGQLQESRLILEQQISDLNLKLDEEKEINIELRRSNDELKDKIKHINKLESELHEALLVISEKSEANKKLLNENAALTEKITKQETILKAIDETRDENEDFRIKNQNLESKLEQLNSSFVQQLDTIRNENTRLSNEIAEKQKIVEDLSNIKEKLEFDISSLKINLNEKSAKVTELLQFETEFFRLGKENQDFKNILIELSKDVEKLNSEKADIESNLFTMINSKKELEDKILNFSLMLSESENKMTVKDKEINSLREELKIDQELKKEDRISKEKLIDKIDFFIPKLQSLIKS